MDVSSPDVQNTPPPPIDLTFNWDEIRPLLLNPPTDPSSPGDPTTIPQKNFHPTFSRLLDTYMSLDPSETFDDIVYLHKLRTLSQGCTNHLAICTHLEQQSSIHDKDDDVRLRREFFEMLAQNLEVFIRGQEKVVEKLWTQSDWKREHDVLGGLMGLSMGGASREAKEEEEMEGLEGSWAKRK
ncbi:Putative protein of unknown function [Podospora comata]|uniref:Uncharacterized protein n=1 Tax=Podospora comata TaxID=48703 RepID=A0ABY6SEC9_PODCO|nr:Putative protein of unknown function [Podospora comata]